jgi:hypothetical protein
MTAVAPHARRWDDGSGVRTKNQGPPPTDGFLSQIVAAVVTTPVTLGVTALGAVVTAARWAVTAVTDLLPDVRPARPRHNAKRVREQLDAARRAAEASGVLWSKVSDRSGRKG